MLLQDYIGSKANLVLIAEKLCEMDRFSHLCSCSASGGRISDGLSSRT